MGLVSAGGHGRRGESGHVLAVVLLATLLLGAGLAIVAARATADRRALAADEERVVLGALADAAVAETLAALAARLRAPGVAPRPFGGGTHESTVTHHRGRRFTITAVARYRGRALAVEVEGRMARHGPVTDGWRRVPVPDPRADGAEG